MKLNKHKLEPMDYLVTVLVALMLILGGIGFMLRWLFEFVDPGQISLAITILVYAAVMGIILIIASKVVKSWRDARVTTIHKDENAVIHGRGIYSAVNFNKPFVSNESVDPQASVRISHGNYIDMKLLEDFKREREKLQIEREKLTRDLLENPLKNQEALEREGFYRSKKEG